MNKNLSILGGNCNCRRYIPELIALIQAGAVKPEEVLTNHDQLVGAIDA